MTLGGEGSSGFKFSKETKSKMSKTRKGMNCGEKSGNAILTEETVKIIKIKLANGEKVIDIANEFKIPKECISSIKQLNTWKHVLPELENEIKKYMNKFINKNIAKEIKIMLAKGINIDDIINKFNVSRRTVKNIKYFKAWSNILPELNEKIREYTKDNIITEDEVKEIKKMLANNERIIDIMNALKVNRDAISNIKQLRTYKYILPELNEKIKKG